MSTTKEELVAAEICKQISDREALIHELESNPEPKHLLFKRIREVENQLRTQKYPKGLSAFYPSRGDFIALVGSMKNPFFFWKALRRFRRVKGLRSQGLLVPGSGALVQDVRRSDHAPFWDAGIPAILVTDTSFFRNPFYHSPQDTTEKLDISFMARITQALLETIISF